jgi:RimJ/RimL family protein N-acetyltransferase
MNVRLIALSVPLLETLASGDVSMAEDTLNLTIPPDFAAQTGKWAFFAASDWSLHAVVHEDATIVGDAGFKGAPDSAGAVEIGYAILESQRRRGYATAAVRLLLDIAAAEPNARLVRAVISPDNAASIAVVTRAGFTHQGDVMHPQDGRQLLFTRPPPRI